jgi:hypothetical protein
VTEATPEVFARPSESQKTRNRFSWRNAQKQPTRNTVAKKRAGREDVDSDYLFGNFLAALRVSFNGQQGEAKPAGRIHSREAVLANLFGHRRTHLLYAINGRLSIRKKAHPDSLPAFAQVSAPALPN